MAGRKKAYLFDWIKLLVYAFLALIALLFYSIIVEDPRNLLIFLYFAGGIYLYYKRGAIKNWLAKNVFTKRYLFSFFKHIPSVVWGGFAVFGIFFFGFLVGIGMSEGEFSNVTDENQKEIQKYKDVISSYKSVSKLYYLQGQDMDIVTDMSKWDQYPEEVFEAIDSYKQKKDEIIFEYGRLYEVLKRANMPEDPYLKTN